MFRRLLAGATAVLMVGSVAPVTADPAVEVAAGGALQAAVDAAPPGATLRLAPGEHLGPITIRRPLTLAGPRSAVVRSDGRGTTIDVLADDVTLSGFTIHGSGDRPDLTDAAVHVRGDDVRVEGLRIVAALFGVAAERSRRVAVVGNEIVGDPATPVGLRGDGVRLWETHDSRIEGNTLDHGRDVVVWYASNNRVIGNVVRDGRYGTHLMYSDGTTIEDNRYAGNVVGVFIMYSRDVKVRRNLLAYTSDLGMGLGAKDSGGLVVEDNRCVRNETGLYLDGSPFRPEDANVFRGNRFELCETAVVLHSSQVRNTFEDNAFRANREQVRVEGRGDALGVDWKRNYFDDYEGYDFDRDGLGDVPYESRSFSNRAIGKRPELAFFRGTPALGLLDMVGRVFPLFQPSPVLVDPSPRMAPPAVGEGAP